MIRVYGLKVSPAAKKWLGNLLKYCVQFKYYLSKVLSTIYLFHVYGLKVSPTAKLVG